MTRLIDGDALKKVILSKSDSMEDLWDTAGVLNAINNAPTVELQSCVAKVTLSEEQLNEIVARVTERAITERLLEVAGVKKT